MPVIVFNGYTKKEQGALSLLIDEKFTDSKNRGNLRFAAGLKEVTDVRGNPFPHIEVRLTRHEVSVDWLWMEMQQRLHPLKDRLVLTVYEDGRLP